MIRCCLFLLVFLSNISAQAMFLSYVKKVKGTRTFIWSPLPKVKVIAPTEPFSTALIDWAKSNNIISKDDKGTLFLDAQEHGELFRNQFTGEWKMVLQKNKEQPKHKNLNIAYEDVDDWYFIEKAVPAALAISQGQDPDLILEAMAYDSSNDQSVIYKLCQYDFSNHANERIYSLFRALKIENFLRFNKERYIFTGLLLANSTCPYDILLQLLNETELNHNKSFITDAFIVSIGAAVDVTEVIFNLKFFLKNKMPIDGKEVFLSYAFTKLMQENSADEMVPLIEILVDNGGNILERDKYGKTILHSAIEMHGYRDMSPLIKYLIETMPNIDKVVLESSPSLIDGFFRFTCDPRFLQQAYITKYQASDRFINVLEQLFDRVNNQDKEKIFSRWIEKVDYALNYKRKCHQESLIKIKHYLKQKRTHTREAKIERGARE